MLWIAWTTVSKIEDGEKLAAEMVAAKLAVCCQMSGEIRSWYHWESKLGCDTEYRLTIKFLDENLKALKAWVLEQHPYETPQFVALPLKDVSESYMQWALSDEK